MKYQREQTLFPFGKEGDFHTVRSIVVFKIIIY